jgi:oxygen-dependent protoporphyrinogen oxidase
MGGIHTSDPERQSLLSTFPRFVDLERKHGSLIRGMLAAARKRPPDGAGQPPFMTLKGGLGVLISTLASKLERVQVVLRCTVERLVVNEPRGYRLRLDNGAELEADVVVLAVPAIVAARLLGGLNSRLCDLLASIRYVTTATVSLGYRRSDLARPLDGFGFVIPSKERRRITGCTFTSTKFDGRAPAGSVLLRCFLGEATGQSAALLPEDEMVRVAREELRELMGIQAEPVLTRVYRWPDAHPQYDVGHLDRLSEIEQLCAACPGLYLTGSSYRGVGLPDCIHNGAQVAERILEESRRRIE